MCAAVEGKLSREFFLFIYKKITRGEYDKPISVDFLSLIFF